MAKAVQNCVQGVQDHNWLLCRDLCTNLRFGGYQVDGSSSLCPTTSVMDLRLCRCVLASPATRALHCGDPGLDKETVGIHPGNDLAFKAVFAGTEKCWIEMV